MYWIYSAVFPTAIIVFCLAWYCWTKFERNIEGFG
jgi:hypothetical protein